MKNLSLPAAPNAVTERLFLWVPELASALGVPLSTVYAWTAQTGPDSIPRVRLGKKYGFDLQDVIHWLKTQQDPRQHAPVRARRMPPRIRRRGARVTT